MMVVFNSSLVMLWIGQVKPMETIFLLRLEIFNELCMLFSSYHLFLFTVFVPDLYMQYDIGYVILHVKVRYKDCEQK